VLVSSCPGGTASNVISFLAKADVALSVTITAVSTILAVAMTPALTALLAGSRIDVNATGLLLSTVQVVILPVVIGIALNKYLTTITHKMLAVAPFVAVITIVLIVASIIGAGKQQIMTAGFRLLLAVFTLHVGGFSAGYVAGRLMFHQEITARTIAIEVGMQNSGLGVVLARQNFISPLVAIPCAISAVFHSLIGSLLAAFWRQSTESKTPQDY
jgi:BASS family bile acid:Na+ symporter